MTLAVVLHPPREVAAALLGLLGAAMPLGFEMLEAERVWLVLVHAGRCRRAEVEQALESVEAAASMSGGVEIAVTEVRGLPETGRLRSLAAMVKESRGLRELRLRLASRLLRWGRSGEDFVPHITLARAAGNGVARRAEGPNLFASGQVVWRASEVSVLSMRVAQGGTRYDAIARVALGG